MAITYFNVLTGERRTVDTEPMIAAFYNSTDQHANAKVPGQDFGWRIAPETVKRIREIKADENLMNRIASSFQLALDDVSDTDVLRWISLEDARKEAAEKQVKEGDYTKQYEEELRALEVQNKVENDPNPSQPAGAEKVVPKLEDRNISDMASADQSDSGKIKESETEDKEEN